MMIDRRVFENGVYTHSIDIDWRILRSMRDQELVRTDPWALKDRTMSQEKKDYRTFLRDLPGDNDSANDAADSWAAYEIPE
jgi:hypothetical protein